MHGMSADHFQASSAPTRFGRFARDGEHDFGFLLTCTPITSHIRPAVAKYLFTNECKKQANFHQKKALALHCTYILPFSRFRDGVSASSTATFPKKRKREQPSSFKRMALHLSCALSFLRHRSDLHINKRMLRKSCNSTPQSPSCHPPTPSCIRCGCAFEILAMSRSAAIMTVSPALMLVIACN